MSPRQSCATSAKIPWRVYRPGVVVGHSETGEIDKIDGPYYFFSRHPAAARRAAALAAWHRHRGRRDQHRAGGLRGQGDGLPGPPARPRRAGVPPHRPGAADRRRPDQGAHQGRARARCPRSTSTPAPSTPCRSVSPLRSPHLPGARQVTDLALAELGIPREMFAYLTYPTHFDSTKTQQALAGSGISVPPLATYAQTLWEYWERNYSPDRRKDRALARAIQRQDRPDHRRVLGYRPGHRAARRCGRRPGHPRRADRGEAGADPAGDRRPRRHRVRAPLRPVRHDRHRADGQGGARRARPCRRAGEQRRPLDPPVHRADLRPLPRLRAHHAAELLRRGAADPVAAAGDAPAQPGRPQGRAHHQRQLDRRADQHARASPPTSPRRRRWTRSPAASPRR